MYIEQGSKKGLENGLRRCDRVHSHAAISPPKQELEKGLRRF
jgi:hypothetical protein